MLLSIKVRGMDMTNKNKQLGERGEEVACRYLEGKGARIIERNWKCRAGEADIIMRDCGDLVFVEVKVRKSDAAGLPEDAVTLKKRQRYERIALQYLFSHDLPSARVRFDVIAMAIDGKGRTFIRHHENAFGEGE